MNEFNLKSNVAEKFRDTINEFNDFTMKHDYEKYFRRKKSSEKVNSWKVICTIMDRIEDLVYYLNIKELNTGKWDRCAFDFYEFIEQAAVMVECVNHAFNIYNMKNIKHRKIFHSKKIININNNCSKDLDDDYFKYIRSLSSVHPCDTSEHNVFQEANFEVSPYVVWNNGYYSPIDVDADLIIVTYNNETQDFIVNKYIYLKEIFNYIKYKYYSLNFLSKKIKVHYNKTIQDYRNCKIKKTIDYENYLDYLKNLKKEAEMRNPELVDYLNDVINIHNIKLSDERNNIKLDKYKTALKYSIKYTHRQLQNMFFDNTNGHDRLLGDLLFGRLYTNTNLSNILNKLYYLKQDNIERKNLIDDYKILSSFFSKYIFISNSDLDNMKLNELFILSRIALYFHALEHKNLISDLIPNTKEYR